MACYGNGTATHQFTRYASKFCVKVQEDATFNKLKFAFGDQASSRT